MNAENQLLQPTGQATPNTQNAQVAPGLNITQTGDQLQYSDQSLFSGASNRQIVVLKESSAVAGATTTASVNTTQSNSYSAPIVFFGIGLLITISLLIVIKIQSKKQDNLTNG